MGGDQMADDVPATAMGDDVTAAGRPEFTDIFPGKFAHCYPAVSVLMMRRRSSGPSRQHGTGLRSLPPIKSTGQSWGPMSEGRSPKSASEAIDLLTEF